MKKKAFMKFFVQIIFVSTLLLPQAASAGIFCAVGTSWGEGCNYTSLDQCLRAVGNRGACVVNQQEVDPIGHATFCVVSNYGTKCYYNDVQSCQQAAGSSGVCVVNPNR